MDKHYVHHMTKKANKFVPKDQPWETQHIPYHLNKMAELRESIILQHKHHSSGYHQDHMMPYYRNLTKAPVLFKKP
eukprot:12926527-Prorocentrum_lima.AAC.1